MNSYENIAFKKFQQNNNLHFATKSITSKGILGDGVYDNLSQIFYSQKNIDKIQHMIKQMVLKKTNNKFKLDDNQDENDLLVVMRAIFLEHAKFLPFDISKQIKELNLRTVNYIVPDMITRIKENYFYIKNMNEPIKPMDLPINVNNAGRKTLPSFTSVWNF